MVVLEDLYNKNHIFEIYVKQLEFKVENKRLINFLWKSETSEYRTKNILLHKDLTKHRIDDKVVLKYVFKKGVSTLTHLEVFDASDDSKDKLIGECEIDLLKLVDVKNPVKFKFTSDNKVVASIHTYISTVSRPTPVMMSKSLMSSKSALSQKKEEMNATEKSLLQTQDLLSDHLSVFGASEGEVYDKIGRMSIKLSNIEREILKKTYRLGQIGKDNLSEMSKIKAKLEKDLMKKDLQIKVLLNQLDELHTSLALSHQREFELTEKIQCQLLPSKMMDTNRGRHLVGPRLFDRNNEFDGTVTAYNKSIINELETNINNLHRFKEDYETLKDPGVKIDRCKEIINNLEKIKKLPKYLTTRTPSNSSRSVKSSSKSLNLVKENVSVGKEHYSISEVGLPGREGNELNERVLIRELGIVKDKTPLNTLTLFDRINKSPKTEQKLTLNKDGDLRAFVNRMETDRSGLFQVPRLVESKDKTHRIFGGGVFIPKAVSITTISDNYHMKRFEPDAKGNKSKSGSVSGKSVYNDQSSVINGLEKELVVTKVKLADSETTKEVYLNQLKLQGPELMA